VDNIDVLLNRRDALSAWIGDAAGDCSFGDDLARTIVSSVGHSLPAQTAKVRGERAPLL
jgi:hypothetical protein